MFELMDAHSQSAVIKVIGVGGGETQLPIVFLPRMAWASCQPLLPNHHHIQWLTVDVSSNLARKPNILYPLWGQTLN